MVETRPSGASRWTKCSAAPLFATLAPAEPESEPAMEGTCAAWVAELVLNGQALRAADMVGEFHPNGWEVDLEMAGHIQEYVDMIRREGGFISAERFVRLSPLVAGTLDNAASMVDGTLHVRDLKYGFRLIEADAEQLVIYGAALALEHMEQGGVRQIVTEIYQPRGFHHLGIHRRKVWTPAELFDRANWIAQRAEECHKPNPVATPGPHCAECPAAAGCQALQATVQNLAMQVESQHHRQMTGAEIAIQLTRIKEAKKMVDAAAKALEAEALARHTTGEQIPGWGLSERLGHRKFKVSMKAVKALTGIDPTKQVDMTPAELKASGASERQMNVLTHRPVIGHKLAPLDPNELQRQFERTHHG